MGLRFYANAPATTLSASATNVAVTITVTATTGFPVSYPYTLILDRGLATEEVVSVTAAAGNVLTVTRGYDSTTSFAHSSGAVVLHGFSAIDPREANAHVNATSAVHGVAGTIVGTTDFQTLTTKTIALGSNTISGTTAQFNVALTDNDFATLAGAETLTNKTLTAPKIDQINDANGLAEVNFTATASAVNGLTVANAATGGKPTISATGTDANVSLNLVPKGTGTVQASGVQVTDVSTAQTLTNKTLSTGTIVGAGTDISGAWTAYTPAWTSTGTAPVLNNGTLVGAYVQIGKTIHFRATLTMGSTTTFGTGSYRLSLPVASLAAENHVGNLLLGGARHASGSYPVYPEFVSTTTVGLDMLPATAGNALLAAMATVPFTWASTDTIDIRGTYEVA